MPAALDTLRDWNYVAETGSEGMTFFHVWWAAFRGMAPKQNEVQLLQSLNENTDEVQEY